MERPAPPRANGETTRGRPPALSPRGRHVAIGAATLVAAGLFVDRPELIVLGSALVAMLFVALVRQYPIAIFVWRRHVELAWRVERPSGDPTLYPGRELTIGIELRNRAPRGLGIATVRPVVSAALEVAAARVETVAGRVTTMKLPLTARAVGVALLHGASVELTDSLGLTQIEAYFPSPIALPIVPRLGAPFAPAGAAIGAGPERAQRSAARLAGQDGQLRELREHRPGDPWKQIAWKASARRGRLMVRELERETQSSHLVVLDVSGAMRQGRVGSTHLDLAIELAARYVRGALEGGDRVGLVTVDGRAVNEVPVSDRPGHRRALMEALTLAPMAYDEMATDLSDSELCATVGRYLLLQEGQETRVAPPPIDDPNWRRLVTSPTGELFDQAKLLDAVRRSRQRSPQLGTVLGAVPPAPRALDPDMSLLRAFCRERAIVLPPLLVPARGAHGLLAALQYLGKGRPPDRIVVLSLLEGLDRGDLVELDALRRALTDQLRALRRRGARASVVAPLSFTPSPGPSDPIDELLGIELQRQHGRLRTLAGLLEVPIQPCRDLAHFRIASIGRVGRLPRMRAA